jgi:pyruvate carboxylase
MDINFLATHPELFDFPPSRDRASKMLQYIASVTVNNPHGLPSKEFAGKRADIRAPRERVNSSTENPPAKTAKQVFDEKGASGLVEWIKSSTAVLLTDTTMRDAHQSLFATRLRTRDILQCSDYYRQHAAGLFSLEMWGGATFDTCLRFLKEDPWERLAQVRAKVPNILLQMLLRGDNAVGYTNYPEWVIRDFIKSTVKAGLDLFRIFDCLNNPEQMAVALDAVKKEGAVAEACICYTGNVISPSENKHTLKYYIDIAKRLQTMGADILCIKDMAGLLRPQAAGVLIKALREEIDLPIHLHTHDTSGNGVAMLLAAAEAGCHIVDGAVASMSGLTSQPSLNALVAGLQGTKRASPMSLPVLDELSLYWESVRSMYEVFDPGIKATSTRVYHHEIPGGQYSNLYDQARAVGLTPTEFFELTERYKEVNDLLGNIVKVTPSSKAVGDFALLLQKHNLTGPKYLSDKPQLDYPDSVVSFFKGHMGVPYGGFPQPVRELILGSNPPPPQKPDAEDKATSEEVRARLEEKLGRPATDRELMSYVLYPKVFLDFISHHLSFHKVDALPTPVFFYGLKPNDEIEVDIEPGKTLVIALQGVSEPDKKAQRTVFFSLNGYPREVKIKDEKVGSKVKLNKKADPMNATHVAAPMPGKVLEVRVKKGDDVIKGQALIITESMKMEYVITAKQSGQVKEVYIKPATLVESGDLLVELGSV